MSGVYIKGMEMPVGCSGCLIDSDSCTLWRELPPERLRDTRPTDCPLVPVPEHWRLIEEKAIKNKADRLRAMTDEEIEDWYWWMHKEMMRFTDSRIFVHDWLKSPVEGEAT